VRDVIFELETEVEGADEPGRVGAKLRIAHETLCLKARGWCLFCLSGVGHSGASHDGDAIRVILARGLLLQSYRMTCPEMAGLGWCIRYNLVSF
jgi:hypothetical protein